MSTYFKVFRVAVTLQAAALLAQAITAGLLLSFPGSGRTIHSATAGIVLLTGLFQLVAAVLVWKPGGGGGRLLVPSLMFVIFEVLQMILGLAHVKWAHVPLGVLLWGGILMLLTDVWGRRRSHVPATEMAV